MEKLFDPIRNQWVAATPEERVRQRLLKLLIEEKGVPSGLIGVELSLKSLCPFQKVPPRRIDIVCLAENSLQPLLLIECKAVRLNPKSLRQLLGYNRFIQAPYVAAANQEELIFGYYDLQNQELKTFNAIPDYVTLMKG